MSKLPLDGITVVGLEQAVAAPFATRQLADLGARVIKVERAAGDFARQYDRTVRGMASYFAWLNRGKESIVLDLKDDEDRHELDDIIGSADVLVQNLAPGADKRLGLSGPELLARHPKLIHVSISGYGQDGPYRDKKAYDLLIQCESGLLSVTGTEKDPAKVGISIADIAAGMYAYTGVLTALYQRQLTGRGSILEVSMLDSLGEWMSQPYLYSEYSGKAPRRNGARHASIAPYGPVQTTDGTVFFGIQNEREWASFCEVVLGDTTLIKDPRYSNNSARVANRESLTEHVNQAFKSLTQREAFAKLDDAGIANASLRSMADFSHHPQLDERNRWREVPSAVGPVRSLLPPVISSTWNARMGPIPELGEHSESIAAEFSGRPDRRSQIADVRIERKSEHD